MMPMISKLPGNAKAIIFWLTSIKLDMRPSYDIRFDGSRLLWYPNALTLNTGFGLVPRILEIGKFYRVSYDSIFFGNLRSQRIESIREN